MNTQSTKLRKEQPVSVTTTLSVPSEGAFEAAFYVYENRRNQPPKRYAPHIHDTLEIYFLLNGESSFSVENEIYNLYAGDAVISRPYELHYCLRNKTARHSHACIWVAPSAKFLLGDFLKSRRTRITLPEAEKIELINAVYRLKAAADRRDTQAQYAHIIYILNLLRPALEKNGADEARTQPLPPVLSAILDDISANFREIESANSLAAKYFVSRSTLARLFAEYMHVTPKAYVESQKLAQARKMLRGGASVYATAAASGFSDSSNFIRLFKARFGITPAKYKSSSSLDLLYTDNVICRKTSPSRATHKPSAPNAHTPAALPADAPAEKD